MKKTNNQFSNFLREHLVMVHVGDKPEKRTARIVGTEPNRLDANKIKEALAIVHFTEKEAGRVEAIRSAIRIIQLTEREVDVLLNATHVNRSELEGSL